MALHKLKQFEPGELVGDAIDEHVLTSTESLAAAVQCIAAKRRDATFLESEFEGGDSSLA